MKNLNKRRLKYGANNTVLIVGALVIFILLNLIATALSEKFPAARIDMTENGLFEIGEATKGVLGDLKDSGDDVTVYYMKNTNDEFTEIKELVLKYIAQNSGLKYEAVNYIRNPQFIERFGVTELSEGSLIVDDATSGRYRVIPIEDMIATSSNSFTQSSAPSSMVLESRLTNAIAYCISRTDDTIVGFSVGHQEANPGTLAQVLSEENLTPVQFDLTTPIPQDCRLLFIISPISDFTSQEIANLDLYLDGGGNVQIAVEPTISLPQLESYLAEWGVTLNNNYVLEGDARYSGAQQGRDIMFPRIASSASDIIASDSRVVGSFCRSLTVVDDPSGAVSHSPIFYTTKNGLAYSIDDPEAEAETGVFDLCVSLEKVVGENYDQTARIIVAGTSSFWGVSNSDELNAELSRVFDENSYGNKSFFVGSVYNMLGIGTTMLTIAGKSLNSSNLVILTEAQQNLYSILFCYAIPAVIILLGLIIWLRRRHL